MKAGTDESNDGDLAWMRMVDKAGTEAGVVCLVGMRRHDVPVHSHAEQLDLIAMCTKGLYFFSTQTLYNCQQLVKSMHR
jgi:hypothetical protein